jgi:tRNA G46 methylase TrmB
VPHWTPPPALPPAPEGRIRGALGGSALYDDGRHAEVRERVTTFVAGEGPLAVEVGFDHGMRLLDHARRWPDIRWLGLEIRKRRVAAAAPHAPPNCLLLRADARTVFTALLPAGRVRWVYVLFPTPTENPRHLLLTPSFVAAVRTALAPDGVLHIATDVEGLHRHASTLLEDWPEAEPPPMGPVISRRERVCARDGLTVYRLSRGRPLTG